MKKEFLDGISMDIIVDILNDTASETQKSEFQNWLAMKNSHAVNFKKIEEIWKNTGCLSDFYSNDTNEAWNILKSKTLYKTNRISNFRTIIYWSTSVAASLLLVLFIGRTVINSRKIILNTNDNIALSNFLPDSSVVDLKYNSKLLYHKRFIRHQREVWLEGEAFFDVKKNSNVPFIIHTNHGQFKVLGTAFNISAYSNDSVVRLCVSLGTVEFFPDTSKSGFKVFKGEELSFNKVLKKIEMQNIENENQLAWKTGVLKFTDARLGDVIKTLELSFNKNIILIGDSIKNELYTATFKNQTLDKIVSVLAITFELQIEKTNETYTLRELSR